MKKKLLSIMLVTALVATAFCGCKKSDANKDSGSDTATNIGENGEIIISYKDVTCNGVEKDGEMQTPVADEERDGYIGTIAAGASVDYTAPENANGTYDVYVKMMKPFVLWGNTPYEISVNGKDAQVQPIDMTTTLDNAGEDGLTPGLFLVGKDLSIKSGDTISLTAIGGMLSYATPFLGDMLLYEAGSQVAVGFGDGIVPKEDNTVDASDPLSGKTILWMGSSVTFGMGASGYSMADYIAESHTGNKAVKYTISGTTLVKDEESKGGSYVERIETVYPAYDEDIDLVVVQLSTNDATKGKPLGQLSDSTDISSFDTSTIIGAEEYLIAYAKERWNCDVVFYTGSYYESEEYVAMVDAVKKVADKWDIGLVNLWDNQEMTDLYGTDKYKEYMPSDGIHPNKLGYSEWWGPEFESYLSEYLSK